MYRKAADTIHRHTNIEKCSAKNEQKVLDRKFNRKSPIGVGSKIKKIG